MSTQKLNLLLFLFAISSIMAACFFGPTPITIQRFIAAAIGNGSIGDMIVIWEIRMPRAIAAFLVGSALGLSGAALQGLLRNPLAEPGILGVSSAAALGATLSLFYGLATVHPLALPIAAISSAIGATLLLNIAAIRTTSVTTLILIGVGLSSFCGALMALLLNLAPNPFTLSDLITWSLGSVANKSFDDLLFTSPFLLIGAILVFLAARGLQALTLGEEVAVSIGGNLKKTRILVITGTGFLTGAAVSIAGAIGFVGIVAPHVLRPFVGYQPHNLLAPSALFGGLMLVVADIAVRLIPTPMELRIGVVAALIGAPAFIWIASRRLHSNA